MSPRLKGGMQIPRLSDTMRICPISPRPAACPPRQAIRAACLKAYFLTTALAINPALAQHRLSFEHAATFPDAKTTGVPPGVTLNPSASLTITKAGTVIDGLDIRGTLVIAAPHVTIKNCRITSASDNVVLIHAGITGARIENSEIDNQGYGGQCIAGQGTFIRNNIHDCADGIDVRGKDTSIQGNYIHRMRGTPDSHLDGIQADGAISNLRILHNTVINEQEQTSAVMVDNYWGPIDRVTIQDNLLVGGGYTIYINEIAKGQNPGGPITNVSLINNSIRAGKWGPLTVRMELGHRPRISGNGKASLATIRRIERND